MGEGVPPSLIKKILNACRILRSSTMLLKINSTLLLITSYKTTKLKKRTLRKIQKPHHCGFVVYLILIDDFFSCWKKIFIKLRRWLYYTFQFNIFFLKNIVINKH